MPGKMSVANDSVVVLLRCLLNDLFTLNLFFFFLADIKSSVTAMPSEDSVSLWRRKLEYLEMQKELIKVCKSQTSQVLFLSYFLPLVDIFVFFMDHCFVLELPVSTYSLFTLLFTTSRVRPYSFHRRHHGGVVVLTSAVLPLRLVIYSSIWTWGYNSTWWGLKGPKPAAPSYYSYPNRTPHNEQVVLIVAF